MGGNLLNETENWGYTPRLPLYSEVKQLLPIIEGKPKSLVTSLIAEVYKQAGTPQQPLDWSAPDTWIRDRLDGAEAELAQHIWDLSHRSVNPRHIRGSYYFINRHNLLDVDPSGIYQASVRSSEFLDENTTLLRTIDEREGIPQLLEILATKTLAKFSDLFPEWSAYAQETSKYRATSSIKSLLRDRLGNLLERGLITREGVVYSITPRGIEYASPPSRVSQGSTDPRHVVAQAIRDYNQAQIASLRTLLNLMDPYQFEYLIRDLLEAMGYEHVTVTRESGDRGVDVVATIQFGITTITEVVQVKRHQGTISRPTIDQLRGALPYHNAIRGTIITTGTFSRGCAEAALYMGAAPISLIDGDRLEELLVEHEIGIRKRPAMLYEVDAATFSTDNEHQDVEPLLTRSE